MNENREPTGMTLVNVCANIAATFIVGMVALGLAIWINVRFGVLLGTVIGMAAGCVLAPVFTYMRRWHEQMRRDVYGETEE